MAESLFVSEKEIEEYIIYNTGTGYKTKSTVRDCEVM